jgi:hypothetical protein
MKARLEFEMPDNCWSCFLESNHACMATENHRQIEPGKMFCKPDWCPLQEVNE